MNGTRNYNQVTEIKTFQLIKFSIFHAYASYERAENFPPHKSILKSLIPLYNL